MGSDVSNVDTPRTNRSTIDRRIGISGNPRGPGSYPARRISILPASEFQDPTRIAAGILVASGFEHNHTLGLTMRTIKPFCGVENLGMCVEHIVQEPYSDHDCGLSDPGLYNTVNQSTKTEKSYRTFLNTLPLRKQPTSIMPSTSSIHSLKVIDAEKHEMIPTEKIAHGQNEHISAADAEFLAGFSDEQRKRVLRKVDWRLVPMLLILYLISFIDRANIGMLHFSQLSLRHADQLRQRQNRRLAEGPSHVRHTIQHCIGNLLCTVHSCW